MWLYRKIKLIKIRTINIQSMWTFTWLVTWLWAIKSFERKDIKAQIIYFFLQVLIKQELPSRYCISYFSRIFEHFAFFKLYFNFFSFAITL